MKNSILLLLLPLFLFSCSKEENELEGVVLNNPNDLQEASVDYLTFENVSKISCDVIRVDVKLKSENIPSFINYTNVVIFNPNPSRSRLINLNDLEDVYLTVGCGLETEFKLFLYNEPTEESSLPSLFLYQP